MKAFNKLTRQNLWGLRGPELVWQVYNVIQGPDLVLGHSQHTDVSSLDFSPQGRMVAAAALDITSDSPVERQEKGGLSQWRNISPCLSLFCHVKKKIFPETVSIDFSVFPIIYYHVTWIPTTERKTRKESVRHFHSNYIGNICSFGRRGR